MPTQVPFQTVPNAGLALTAPALHLPQGSLPAQVMPQTMPAAPVFPTGVRLLGTFPLPGTPGVPHFNRAEISEFLQRYEEMVEDYQLGIPEALKRLPRYCEPAIGEHIRTMVQWLERDWQDLKGALAMEYRNGDSY